jgi:hypothetical protein
MLIMMPDIFVLLLLAFRHLLEQQRRFRWKLHFDVCDGFISPN